MQLGRNLLIEKADPQGRLLRERLDEFEKVKKNKRIDVLQTGVFPPSDPGSNTQKLYEAVIKQLNVVNQGVDDFNRTGIRTLCKKLRITFDCVYGGSQYRNLIPSVPTLTDVASIVGNPVRMMVLWDKQPNGTTPTIGEILRDLSYDGVINQIPPSNTNFEQYPKIYASKNVVNIDRFTVLRDDFMILADPTPYIPGNTAPANGSGSFPNFYSKTFLLDVPAELLSKGVMEKDLETRFKVEPGVNPALTIVNGALVSVLYFLKPNFSYNINSSVNYENH